MPAALSIDPYSNFGFISPECFRPPPGPLEGEPSVSDSCHVIAPLVDLDNVEEARLIRFDRKEDRYVLSPKNSEPNIAWVQSFPNRPDIAQFIKERSSPVGSKKEQPREPSVNTISNQMVINADLLLGGILSKNELKNRARPAAAMGAELGLNYFPSSWRPWGGNLDFQYLRDFSGAHRLIAAPSFAYLKSPFRMSIGIPLGLNIDSRNKAHNESAGFLAGLTAACGLVHRFGNSSDHTRGGLDLIGVKASFFHQIEGANPGPQGVFLISADPIGLFIGASEIIGEGLKLSASNAARKTF